jgi:hypothetical protein
VARRALILTVGGPREPFFIVKISRDAPDIRSAGKSGTFLYPVLNRIPDKFSNVK